MGYWSDSPRRRGVGGSSPGVLAQPAVLTASPSSVSGPTALKLRLPLKIYENPDILPRPIRAKQVQWPHAGAQEHRPARRPGLAG